MHESLLNTPHRRAAAAFNTAATFLGVFWLIVASACATLLFFVPHMDLQIAEMKAAAESGDDEPGVRSQCLRVSHHGDYLVAHLGVGVPVQYLQLLLRVDAIVENELDALFVHTPQLLKSQTITCGPVDAELLVAECRDQALVADGTGPQRHVLTSFSYSTTNVAQYAYALGLDGELKLRSGSVAWISTTHLCFADETVFGQYRYRTELVLDPNRTLPFDAVVGDGLTTTREALASFAPLGDTLECGSEDGEIRLFPPNAYNEYSDWLTLSGARYFEYAGSTLSLRRTIVEAGSQVRENNLQCLANSTSDSLDDVERSSALYSLDCTLAASTGATGCQAAPSIPFRRLSQHRLRIEIDTKGNGFLTAEATRLLSRLPKILDFDQAFWISVGRLSVLLLTAAVVFIRGAQRSTDPQWLLRSAVDDLRIKQLQPDLQNFNGELSFFSAIVLFDLGITLAALVARIIVLAFVREDLFASELTVVFVAEITGIVSSALHLILRYPPLMRLSTRLPVQLLGGPMSSCDAAASVLLAFSEPPLLTVADGRFAAIGRLLIALLITVSVLPRCLFGAMGTALGASTVANADDYKSSGMVGMQTMFGVAAALWTLQAASAATTLAALFVNPAAYALTRMLRGDVLAFPFVLLVGTLSAGLPTVTKTVLAFVKHVASE